MQLWDQVKTDLFEIKDVCTGKEKEIFFSVEILLKDKCFKIDFKDNGFSVEDIFFSVSGEGFSTFLENPEFIFKISMFNTRYIKKTGDKRGIKIFIPQQDFFKGVAEFLLLTKF